MPSTVELMIVRRRLFR